MISGKTCPKCTVRKPLSAYHKNKCRSDGLATHCKECTSEMLREWRVANPERAKAISRKTKQKHIDANRARCRAYAKAKRAENPGYFRARHLKFAYGLTPAEWQAMFDAQEQRCKICGTNNPRGKRARWHTDHNHATGKVRGILCSKCNSGIGLMEENVEVLQKAAAYVKERDQ